jgi:hypothetical protein
VKKLPFEEIRRARGSTPEGTRRFAVLIGDAVDDASVVPW